MRPRRRACVMVFGGMVHRRLEGFLGLGVVYSVEPNITPDAFTRVLLDQWKKT